MINPKFLALLEKVTKTLALNSFCTHGSTAAGMQFRQATYLKSMREKHTGYTVEAA